jgi:hypothetical protein
MENDKKFRIKSIFIIKGQLPLLMKYCFVNTSWPAITSTKAHSTSSSIFSRVSHCLVINVDIFQKSCPQVFSSSSVNIFG